MPSGGADAERWRVESAPGAARCRPQPEEPTNGLGGLALAGALRDRHAAAGSGDLLDPGQAAADPAVLGRRPRPPAERRPRSAVDAPGASTSRRRPMRLRLPGVAGWDAR